MKDIDYNAIIQDFNNEIKEAVIYQISFLKKYIPKRYIENGELKETPIDDEKYIFASEFIEAKKEEYNKRYGDIFISCRQCSWKIEGVPV